MRKRVPEFDNILSAFRREKPSRPTLFELDINISVYEAANGRKYTGNDMLSKLAFTAEAHAKLGYDYIMSKACDMVFPTGRQDHLSTVSVNDGGLVTDWQSFERYPWPEVDAYDDSHLKDITRYLLGNMKVIVVSPGGILRNLTEIVGYDNLCYMLYEEPELVDALLEQIGKRIYRYYERALEHDTVGGLCINDDWGFNTQTLLSPDMMRKYIFPWHKRYVKLAHEAGRPMLLHSCGNLTLVMQDVVDMEYDAKHSYEDVIQPVEDFYEQWHEQLCIVGGMDVDFMCRQSEEAITERVRAMCARTDGRGGYLMGTGNSVPVYMPQQNYMAMVRETLGYDPLL